MLKSSKKKCKATTNGKKILPKSNIKSAVTVNVKDRKNKSSSKKIDLETDASSENDSGSVKNLESTTSKKLKNIINASKKSLEKNEGYSSKSLIKKGKGNTFAEESEDDEKECVEESLKSKAKKTVPVVKPETRVKLPLNRVVKGKNHVKPKTSAMCSDSETSLNTSPKETRSKTISENIESPLTKKQHTRSSTKKEGIVSPELESKNSSKGKGKETAKPIQRMSQRVMDKSKDLFDDDLDKTGKDKVSKTGYSKKGEKASVNSDTEEPLSKRLETKKEDMAEMREMFKKYISKLDIKDDSLKSEDFSKKNYESSDSEEPNKASKLKQDTESESDMEKKNVKKSTKKSKTESLEEKVQKIKKQKNIVDDKKLKNKKPDDKEEMKEKEETIVSSSSQEPITRSIAVQTNKVEAPVEETQELEAKTERIGELEKDLQGQINANKLLEVELNKIRVLLDRIRNDHEDEISEINSKHAMNISEIKKKQWVSLE